MVETVLEYIGMLLFWGVVILCGLAFGGLILAEFILECKEDYRFLIFSIAFVFAIVCMVVYLAG